MALRVTFDIINPSKDSIYCILERRLGRKPTNAECREEIFRIIEGSSIHERKSQCHASSI